MSGESPNVILYDSNGDAMAVSNNAVIPSGGSGTSALLLAGSDGVNAHYMLMDSSGRPIVDQGLPNVTLADAWLMSITDGYHGPAGVKPSGLSAVATDPSLVITLTPNLPLTTTVSSTNINASTAGNNTLIAGVSGKTIRVFKVALVFSVGGTVIFQDGNSTALSGPMVLNAGATIVLDMDVTNPWFLTSAGNGFVVNLAGGAAVGGVIYYTQS
jgi:hypothetical protein